MSETDGVAIVQNADQATSATTNKELQNLKEGLAMMTNETGRFYEQIEKKISSDHGIYLMAAGAVLMIFLLLLRIFRQDTFISAEFITLALIALFITVLGSYYRDKNKRNLAEGAQIAHEGIKNNVTALADANEAFNFSKKET